MILNFVSNRYFQFIGLISFTLVSPLANYAQDVERGKQQFALCSACHGNEGQGNHTLKAPAIAGLSEWYVSAQLKKFKEGIRGAHHLDTTGLLMRPMARSIANDEDIRNLAAYVAQLKPTKNEDTLDGDAQKGQTLYVTCLACHGDKMQGNELLKAPALNVLDDWYMLAQLKKFKTGIRGTHKKDITGAQMRPMAMTLIDEQAMKDVIAYVRSQSKK